MTQTNTHHRPIFLTCMEPTLESATILMKFTQDVCMDEKTSWPTNVWNRMGGGVPLIYLYFWLVWRVPLKVLRVLTKTQSHSISYSVCFHIVFATSGCLIWLNSWYRCVILLHPRLSNIIFFGFQKIVQKTACFYNFCAIFRIYFQSSAYFSKPSF